MPDKACLLVNADDFGLHADINRGILECIERGRVQSVSFSPTGRSVDWHKLLEFVRYGVRTGLHITLVGEPWATDGRVVRDWKDLGKRLLLANRSTKAAVELEIQRQFQFCADNGFDPRWLSHVDSHQHVHVFNGIWEPCLRLAQEFAVPRIRVPWCPSLKIIKKSLGGVVLQTLARGRAAEVKNPLPCIGLAHAGHNTVATLSQELAHAARSGHSEVEMVVHPGVNSPDLESRYAEWQFEWSRERDALLSPEFADAVTKSGYAFAASARVTCDTTRKR